MRTKFPTMSFVQLLFSISYDFDQLGLRWHYFSIIQDSIQIPLPILITTKEKQPSFFGLKWRIYSMLATSVAQRDDSDVRYIVHPCDVDDDDAIDFRLAGSNRWGTLCHCWQLELTAEIIFPTNFLLHWPVVKECTLWNRPTSTLVFSLFFIQITRSESSALIE